MGNQPSVQPSIITKLDEQQILWNLLINSARLQVGWDAISNKFNKDCLEFALREAVKKLAASKFQEVYHYAFNNTASKCKPQKATGQVKTLKHLCGIDDPVKQPTQARDYINTLFRAESGLPGWIRDNACNDLVAISDNLIRQPESLEWRVDKYTRTFDAALEDQKSYQIDTIIASVNYKFFNSLFEPIFCLIYFLNVYYEVESQTRSARTELQRSSYSKFRVFDPNSSVVENESQLEATIKETAGHFFENEFKYKYTERPSDILPGSSPTWVNTTAFTYIADPDQPQMDGFVDQQFFKGLAFKDDYFKVKIREGILGQLNHAASPSGDTAWRAQTIDQVYTPSNPAGNLLKGKGIVISFYDRTTVSLDNRDQTVSILYIFVLASFYEAESVTQLLVKDVFADLVTNLLRHFLPDKPINSFDAEKIKELMFDYLKQQFKKTFEFDWKPGGKIPDSDFNVITLKGLIDFGEDDPDVSSMKERVDATGFKRGGLEFRNAIVQAHVYDELVKSLQTWTNGSVPREINQWYSQPRNGVIPFGEKYIVQEYTFFLYALGDRSTGGTRVLRPFVGYISMFGFVDKEAGFPSVALMSYRRQSQGIVKHH